MEEITRRYAEAPEIRKFNKEERTVEFVASTNDIDSYGTVLPVDKWDLSRFERNGIIGYQHDVYGHSNGNDPDDVIGKGVAFVDEDKLIVRITFEPAELNEKADKIFRKIEFGSINGVSVGFAPTAPGHWGDERKGENPDVYYFNGQQLLEVSVVNIPSNPNALKRSAEDYRKTLPAKPVEAKQEDATNDYFLTIAKAKRILAQNTTR